MADEDVWYESVAFEVILWIIFMVWPCFTPVALMFGSRTTYFRRLSMACYVYMWIYITALILMTTVTQVEDVLEGIDLVFKIGIPVTYLIVLFETCTSSEAEYIGNISDATGTEEFFETLRQSLGAITFHATCYH